jgi:hypothetical protein
MQTLASASTPSTIMTRISPRYIEELGPKSPRIAASPIRNTRCTIEWGLTADEGTDKTPVPTDLSQTADDADMSWSSMPRLAVC